LRSFYRCISSNSYHLVQVLLALTGLTKLDISCRNMSPHRLSELLPIGLQHPAIRMLPSGASSVAESVGALPSLRHLEFSWSDCSLDLGGALQALTALTALVISPCFLSSQFPICNRGPQLSFLTALSELRDLSVPSVDMLDVGNVRCIAALTGLTRLHVRDVSRLLTHDEVQEFSQLTSLQRLERFCMWGYAPFIQHLNGLRHARGLPPICLKSG
jgi:hypothetical protein